MGMYVNVCIYIHTHVYAGTSVYGGQRSMLGVSIASSACSLRQFLSPKLEFIDSGRLASQQAPKILLLQHPQYCVSAAAPSFGLFA